MFGGKKNKNKKKKQGQSTVVGVDEGCCGCGRGLAFMIVAWFDPNLYVEIMHSLSFPFFVFRNFNVQPFAFFDRSVGSKI